MVKFADRYSILNWKRKKNTVIVAGSCYMVWAQKSIIPGLHHSLVTNNKKEKDLSSLLISVWLRRLFFLFLICFVNQNEQTHLTVVLFVTLLMPEQFTMPAFSSFPLFFLSSYTRCDLHRPRFFPLRTTGFCTDFFLCC